MWCRDAGNEDGGAESVASGECCLPDPDGSARRGDAGESRNLQHVNALLDH